MTTKKQPKPTKQQIEQKAKDALIKRITDIYSGASGSDMSKEDAFIGLYEASNAIPAMRDIFSPQVPNSDYLWMPHMLDKYEDPRKAAEVLFNAGVRA